MGARDSHLQAPCACGQACRGPRLLHAPVCGYGVLPEAVQVVMRPTRCQRGCPLSGAAACGPHPPAAAAAPEPLIPGAIHD